MGVWGVYIPRVEGIRSTIDAVRLWLLACVEHLSLGWLLGHFYLIIRLRARDLYEVIVDEGQSRINCHINCHHRNRE